MRGAHSIFGGVEMAIDRSRIDGPSDVIRTDFDPGYVGSRENEPVTVG